jgi:fucokinase
VRALENGSAAFLQQAHRNNWQQYLASLAPDGPRGWDLCVLTASDERQAAIYRRQLAVRREAGLLPPRTRFAVVADPDGRRIGSGGATLRVLTMLAEGAVPGGEGGEPTPLPGDLLAAGWVLIAHSGGDSRRLPHCSAIGKLFARIPHALPDGRASTLFDEFFISLSGLSFGLPPGVLVASGDVLLIFDHLQIQFHRPGAIGVAAAAPQETGTHHGVYVTGNGHTLAAYLHKPSLETLRRWDAVADDGTVSIDTGFVWFDAPTVRRMIDLARERAVAGDGGPSVGLNLYGDLLMPLAGSTTRKDYLADTSDGPATPAVRAAREVIWSRLRDVPFTVERLQPAVFLHFGTSQEYWALVTRSPDLARTCGWTSETASWTARPGTGRLALINAALQDEARLDSQARSAAALIVDAHLAAPLSLRGAALIAGLHTAQPLALEPDVVLHQLPLAGGRFVTRVHGLHDNPKLSLDDPAATFMNVPWAAWLARAGIEPETLWPGMPPADRTLWNARLYPPAHEREASLALALPLQDPGAAPEGWRARWERAPRLSLSESFVQADGERILAASATVEDEVAARRFFAALQGEQPAAECRDLLGPGPAARARRAERVAAWLTRQTPISRLRGYKALHVATGQTVWEDRAFGALAAAIAEATEEDVGRARGSRARDCSAAQPALREDMSGARLEAAARIDFGGGWTDTPPYSIERGGTVLNGAITLRHAYPIVVEAERLSEPRLILCSRDIGAEIEPRTVGEVLAYANPADPFALLKAAVVLRGLVPADADPGRPLSEVLARGRGLRLGTQTSIPRGSGLGTSSILAGAVLSCLARLQGHALDQARLFDEVLCLEQMMTTGGGWQDQVGGLTGGIKLITTAPGLPQQIRAEPLELADETRADLDRRLLLVYTGQQRLAKNLLRAVMARWMARDPEMVWILSEIARLAVEMRGALLGGDLDRFGELLGEHWTLNKRMDPGCTNPFIDRLFEVMGPYINGGKLAGAGGGGFAIVIARDEGIAQALSSTLGKVYARTQVGVWPCAVPEEGIR